MGRSISSVLACAVLCACAQASRAEAPDSATSSDAGGDASVRVDAGHVGDAGPKPVRIFVPFPDCTDNDPTAGVAVEGCDCAAPDGTICCTGGAVFECTGFGWRSLANSHCMPSGVPDAPPDASWDPSQPAECHACKHGTAGCWCRSDDTCDEGLRCVESLCGTPAN